MLTDTHQEIDALQLALLRQVPPWRKAHMLGQMYQTTKQLTMAGLRHRYPNETEARLRYQLAELLLGPELAREVYGEANDVD